MVEFAEDTIGGEGTRSKLRCSSKKNKLVTRTQIKKYAGHGGLFLALVIYTAVGALVSP